MKADTAEKAGPAARIRTGSPLAKVSPSLRHLASIAAVNQFPTFPVAERMNASDAKLYSHGVVPAMDHRDEDYILELKVRAGDPDTERALADYCTRAINAVPMVHDQIVFALKKLDSVAFLAEPGETDHVKQCLREAIKALVGESMNAFGDAEDCDSRSRAERAR